MKGSGVKTQECCLELRLVKYSVTSEKAAFELSFLSGSLLLSPGGHMFSLFSLSGPQLPSPLSNTSAESPSPHVWQRKDATPGFFMHTGPLALSIHMSGGE